ncbi:MAG: hypothetical protein ACE5ID_03895 [Acidobacteriota bacterium]
MANRPLIRSNLADVKEQILAKPTRKPVPPESTNAEAFYYVKQINAGTELVVHLDGGEEVQGTLEWYDRAALMLKRQDAPDLLLMKHAIRYIRKNEEDA